MMDLLQGLSDGVGECIIDHYADIGLMGHIKLRFPKDNIIQQYADYFIRIAMAGIEELSEERDEYEKRLTELRRARQGGAGNGDGDKIPERAGLFNQPEFWDYGDRQTYARF